MWCWCNGSDCVCVCVCCVCCVLSAHACHKAREPNCSLNFKLEIVLKIECAVLEWRPTYQFRLWVSWRYIGVTIYMYMCTVRGIKSARPTVPVSCTVLRSRGVLIERNACGLKIWAAKFKVTRMRRGRTVPSCKALVALVRLEQSYREFWGKLWDLVKLVRPFGMLTALSSRITFVT